MTRLLAFFCSISVGYFSSCREREEAMSYAPSQEVESAWTDSVEVGEDYSYQVFVYLGEEGIEQKSVLKTTWDLAFSTQDNTILLNSAKFMMAARASGSFVTTTSAEGLNFVWDDPSLRKEMAIGDGWQEAADVVYVVNLGKDTAGESLGFRKVIFARSSVVSLAVRHALLDGDDEKKAIITLDDRYHYMYFSFARGVVEVAPVSWHICFTQYTHTFTEEDAPQDAPQSVPPGTMLPYLVFGLITNPYTVSVARSSLSFEDITPHDFDAITTPSAANLIGYDWKTYHFEKNSYLVDSTRTYLLLHDDGATTQRYVFRLLDLYSHEGKRGAVSFSYRLVAARSSAAE